MPRGRTKGSRWSDAAKARGRAAEAAKRTGNLSRGTLVKGAEALWTITAPDGQSWTTRGLADWARANAHRTAARSWQSLYYGLRTAGQAPAGWHGWHVRRCDRK